MTREEALELVRVRVAEALDVPPARVRIEWDHKHDKPKVTLLATLDDIQTPQRKRMAILRTLLRDPKFNHQLSLLRESISKSELRDRLRALRDHEAN